MPALASSAPPLTHVSALATVLTGFLHASSGADPRAQAADVADLLASTAVLVGNERAVAALA